MSVASSQLSPFGRAERWTPVTPLAKKAAADNGVMIDVTLVWARRVRDDDPPLLARASRSADLGGKDSSVSVVRQEPRFSPRRHGIMGIRRGRVFERCPCPLLRDLAVDVPARISPSYLVPD